MKTSAPRTAVKADAHPAAEATSRKRPSPGEQALAASPYLTAQRRRIEGLTGGAAQLLAPEEELQMKATGDVAQRAAPEDEMLQGKMEPLQRVEEEELLQGRFAPVQRVEEEELLQGRFAPAQRVEEEDLLQGRFQAIQRVEDEELLQGRFGVAQRRPEPAAQANRTGMPDGLKAGVESLSGLSMDNVRVHYNSAQPAQLNALAYAQGTDIHLGPGQEQHLPHEAWHVVQQAQGRVRPTMQMQGGTPVNDDASLESEADRMGARAMQMRPR